MTRKSKAALFCFLALLLTGCSTIYKRVDPGIGDEVKIEDIPADVAVTHFHEVLDILGPPSRMSSTGSGFAFLYEAMLIRELQTGIGGQNGFWQLIKLSLADSKLFRDTLVMSFNQKGILQAVSYTDAAEPLGRSGAIQPILTVQQIIDTGSFEDDAVDVVDCGLTLLEPLPVVLNSSQSLSSGTGGFEQSGTTTKVGQNSLEMRNK